MLLDQLVDRGLPGAIAGCSSAAQRTPLALKAGFGRHVSTVLTCWAACVPCILLCILIAGTLCRGEGTGSVKHLSQG